MSLSAPSADVLIEAENLLVFSSYIMVDSGIFWRAIVYYSILQYIITNPQNLLGTPRRKQLEVGTAFPWAVHDVLLEVIKNLIMDFFGPLFCRLECP